MAKLLKTKDKVLIALSVFGDLLEEIRDVGGIRSNLYGNVYGFVPENIKKTSYKNSVSKMIKSDLIEKSIENGNPVLRITSQGRKILTRNFPLFNLQQKPWDRKWRVLIFDIPEKKRWRRDSSRNKLKNLGFGMIQQSVWISPHPFDDDIREFVNNLGLTKNVFLFISDKSEVGGIDEHIYDIWNVDEINQNYKKLYNDFDYNKYINVLEKDPFLPKELLPKDWWGFKLRTKLATQK